VVPAANPVITPPALTVATVVLLEFHVPPLAPFVIKVVVLPIQIPCVPLRVPALGGAVTVMVLLLTTGPQPPVAAKV